MSPLRTAFFPGNVRRGNRMKGTTWLARFVKEERYTSEELQVSYYEKKLQNLNIHTINNI